MNTRHRAALHALLAAKIHALPEAGGALRRVLACVQKWNTLLLHFWAHHPNGHLVIGRDGGYEVGAHTVGQRTLHNVAWVSAADAETCRRPVLAGMAHIVDHLLGCDGDAYGLWLSDGGGRNAPWQQVGQRLQARFRLGYGPTPATQTDPHTYFAWGVALYWHDRAALRAADPPLERLLRHTVFSDDFWRAL